MSGTPFRPMRAAKLKSSDLSKLTYPLYGSYKLDGLRCVIRDGVAMTRKLEVIPNKHLQDTLRGLPDGLDGEIIVGSATSALACTTTQSAIMSEDGVFDFTYYLFDYDCRASYAERLSEMTEMLHGEARDGYPLALIHQRILINPAEVEAYMSEAIALGYEGLVLRAKHGPYKYGESTLKEAYLMKYKRTEDDEAEVIGYVELTKNNNEATTDARGYTKRSTHKANKIPMGTLGALSCRTASGVTFELGTGFKKPHRQALWDKRDSLIGSFVTYKHQGFGSKGGPRFPVFVRFRHAADVLPTRGENDAE